MVFLIDVINKPKLEDSLYLRLMLLGRRSDRVVNLFDEHKDAGHFTVDQAMEELEDLVVSHHKNTTGKKKSDWSKSKSKRGRKRDRQAESDSQPPATPDSGD